MERLKTHRRKVLTAAAASCTAAGLVGLGGAQQESSSTSVSRDSFEIMSGTEYETTVYETTASADGGTVVVFGGVHGNEVAGYEAAGVIADWEIEAGTLVVVPEADAPAVEAGTRAGPDGDDLNRQFPEGEEPQTELAQAIWDVITDYDPDVVVDLHESTGIYAGSPVDGVGQAIFHSDDGRATEDAEQAADYVNQNYVGSSEREFVTNPLGPDTNPTDLIVHKTWLDLDARSYLVETLSQDVDLDTRVDWHLQIVGELVEDELFPSGVPEEPTDGPVDEPEEPEDEESEESEDEEPEDEPEDESEAEEPEEPEDGEPEEDSEDEEPEEPEESEDEPEAPEGDESEDELEDDDLEEDGPEDDEPEESEDEEPEDELEEEEPEDEPEEEPEAEEPEESEDEEPEEDSEADEDDGSDSGRPIAEIETIPADADERQLEVGETVTLDASASCVVDGEVECYEWDVDGDGYFDHTGETIDVTVSANGDHTVTLRVTGEDGRTSLAEIVLSCG